MRQNKKKRLKIFRGFAAQSLADIEKRLYS